MSRIDAALSNDHVRATGGFVLALAILIAWLIVSALR